MRTLQLMLLTVIMTISFTTIFAQTSFKHTASASNISNHMTTIENSATNGKSDALLFVTQVYSGKYNNHPFGVWYSGGKWLIYQENKQEMDVGTAYNILAVQPSSSAFMHKSEPANTSGHITTIDNPNCNGNPNAVLFVTQNWKGTYNAKSVAVWYNGSKWTIYNQDKTAMPSGTNFNVMVLRKGSASNISGGNVSIFTANATAKKNSYGNHLANLPLTNAAAKIFVTQNFGENGVYNAHESAVWFDGKNWTVYNKDKVELPANAQFNVLAIGATELLAPDEEVEPINPTSNSNSIEANAVYRLTNSFLKETRCLDVNRTSNAAFMGTTGNYNGQQWYFKSLGNDKYSIHDDYGRVLDVSESKGNPFMSVWGNYNGQYWTIVKQSNGSYRITDAYGRALDTNGGGKNEPMVTKVGNYSGQSWQLIKTGTKGKTVSTNLKNWMSSISDNVSLAALSIPGTHDSGADYGCPTFAYNEYAKCHTQSIPQQLNGGIRYLDIRCRRTGNSFAIHHGQCYQQMNFGEVLQDCQKFLQDNPSETIIMRIKEEHSADSDKSFATIFNGYQSSYSNLFYTSTSIPTMANARGKIVILDNASIGKGISYGSQNNQDDYYFSDKTKKWSPIVNQLNNAKNSSSNTVFYLNHISGTAFSSDAGDLISGFFGAVDSPKDFANYCLPKLGTYFDSSGNGRFGIIIMDFQTNDAVLQIIKTNGSAVLK